jgi:hypothetical protein
MDRYGKWYYERNPSLRPNEYQTRIEPGGRQTAGTARPASVLSTQFRDKSKKKSS